LRTKELRVARTGDAFLALALADKTGSIPGVLFRPSRAAVEIPAGTVVSVGGTVTSFKGVRRVSVDQLAPATAWDRESLIAVGNRPTDELSREFSTLVRLVGHTGLRRLIRVVFGDKAFFARFSECPATRSGHHDHLGGLLEHTVTVSGLCARLSNQYESLDRDLLITSALLHDIGVVDSLSFDNTIARTDEGRLVGHQALGSFRVHEAARRSDLAGEVLSRVHHAILCHHDDGISSDRPLTLEALALQDADRIDSRLTGFSDALHGAVRADEPWTDDQNPFRRQLFAGPRRIEPAAEAESESTPARRLA
jgi:3'-5' exoribonuclease